MEREREDLKIVGGAAELDWKRRSYIDRQTWKKTIPRVEPGTANLRKAWVWREEGREAWVWENMEEGAWSWLHSLIYTHFARANLMNVHTRLILHVAFNVHTARSLDFLHIFFLFFWSVIFFLALLFFNVTLNYYLSCCSNIRHKFQQLVNRLLFFSICKALIVKETQPRQRLW